MVMKGRIAAAAVSIGVDGPAVVVVVAEIAVLHRAMVVSRLNFHRRHLICLLFVPSQFQHLRIVRIDLTETGRYVLPVTALGQRGEPLGQAH